MIRFNDIKKDIIIIISLCSIDRGCKIVDRFCGCLCLVGGGHHAQEQIGVLWRSQS